MQQQVYLDNAATTFPKPECVYQALDSANRTLAMNAGRGGHKASMEAAGIIADCRRQMAALAGAPVSNVVFSPSATIAMNQIVLGLDWSPYKVVYVSIYEHNAAMRPLFGVCSKFGLSYAVLATKADGALDMEQIALQFAKRPPDYVFVSHISNVTGYVLPIWEVSEEAHKYSAIVIADCSQSMGLLSTSFRDLDADYLVFAGHKTLYASFGVGGWISKGEAKLQTVLCGGTGSDSLNLMMPEEMPGRFEPASPNVVAIASLQEALCWRRTLAEGALEWHEREMTQYLLNGLAQNSKIRAYTTHDANAHIGVVSFNHADYMSDELALILDQDFGISVRAGYHCAPLVHDLLISKAKRGTVRASMSYFTKKKDIDALIGALEELD